MLNLEHIPVYQAMVIGSRRKKAEEWQGGLFMILDTQVPVSPTLLDSGLLYLFRFPPEEE